MGGVHAATCDEVTARLLTLAEAGGGTVTAAQVDADELLSRDQNLTSAAARALADACFGACLLRYAFELRRTVNWNLFIRQPAKPEVSPEASPEGAKERAPV